MNGSWSLLGLHLLAEFLLEPGHLLCRGLFVNPPPLALKPGGFGFTLLLGSLAFGLSLNERCMRGLGLGLLTGLPLFPLGFGFDMLGILPKPGAKTTRLTLDSAARG